GGTGAGVGGRSAAGEAHAGIEDPTPVLIQPNNDFGDPVPVAVVDSGNVLLPSMSNLILLLVTVLHLIALLF
ncbi:uncharacterized protein SPAPADRAFT_59123, partial [Spathaspora passalidarum NRRL Y-27907]